MPVLDGVSLSFSVSEASWLLAIVTSPNSFVNFDSLLLLFLPPLFVLLGFCVVAVLGVDDALGDCLAPALTSGETKETTLPEDEGAETLLTSSSVPLPAAKISLIELIKQLSVST